MRRRSAGRSADAGETGPATSTLVEVEEDGRCELRLPLTRPGRPLLGWTFFTYRATDPLAVEVTLRAPSEEVVLDRTVLRADLRIAGRQECRLASVVLGPTTARGLLAVVFYEQNVVVPVFVPTPVLGEFLDACERLVPVDAETDRLSRALEGLMRSGGEPPVSERRARRIA